MAGSPRLFKVTYGTYTVGGDSEDALLDGYHAIDSSVDKDGRGIVVLSFAAIVRGTSASNFASKVSAFETAFRTPRLLVKLENGATPLLTFNPASGTNTGFNATPSIRKSESVADTALSRRYDVTISVELPSQISANNGRRNAAYRISEGPQERVIVTFTGEYTASGSNGALAQFAAQFDTYASSVLTGLGGTFERISRERAPDDADKVMAYTVVYQEILSDQTSSGRNDSAIVDHSVRFSKSIEAPGDWGAETVRLTDVVASYSCSVVKTTTALAALWEGTLKPYLLGAAEGTFGGEAVALVVEKLDIDPTDSRIAATVQLKMAIGTSNILEAEVRQSLRDTGGKAITEVHDDDPLAAYADPGPGQRIRTTTKVFKLKGGASLKKWFGGGGTFEGVGFGNGGVGNDIGVTGNWQGSTAPGSGSGGGGINAGLQPSGGGGSSTGWIRLDGFSEVKPGTLGRDGRTIQTTDYIEVEIERFVNAPSGGGGGGGGIRAGLQPGPGGGFGGLPAVP